MLVYLTISEIREETRRHENIRYFLLEGLKELLKLIASTRSDNFICAA
ncbi:MAG: hypothetical protein ACP5JO_06880 [Candidatus Ratteibacteria bacterium]